MAIDNPFKNLSKTQIYLASGGALAIGGFIVYKHHSSTGSWNPFSKAPAAAATGSTIDPITGLAYSQDDVTDPMTGQTYLAEANQYGSVQTAESAVSAYGQSTATGSGIPVNPASPASSGSINTPVGTSVYTSNAAWDQAATAGLVSVGYDGTTVGAALGAYLTQTPATPAQVTIINTAIGEYGPAPIGNLQIIRAPASGPGATTPVAAPTVSHGKVDSVTQNGAALSWIGNNAVKYQVILSGPGKEGGKQSTVTVPRAVYSGLQPLHNYSIQIVPFNSSGTAGQTAHIDFQTLAPIGKKS